MATEILNFLVFRIKPWKKKKMMQLYYWFPHKAKSSRRHQCKKRYLNHKNVCINNFQMTNFGQKTFGQFFGIFCTFLNEIFEVRLRWYNVSIQRLSIACKLWTLKPNQWFAFFTAVNHQCITKKRNLVKWIKIHQSECMNMTFWSHWTQFLPFLRRLLWWLTVVKSATVSQVFNFRVCMLLKGPVFTSSISTVQFEHNKLHVIPWEKSTDRKIFGHFFSESLFSWKILVIKLLIWAACLIGWIILRSFDSEIFNFTHLIKVARGYLLEQRHPFLNRILGK